MTGKRYIKISLSVVTLFVLFLAGFNWFLEREKKATLSSSFNHCTAYGETLELDYKWDNVVGCVIRDPLTYRWLPLATYLCEN